MKISYMSWLRNHVGIANEDINLPENISTLEGVVSFLKSSSQKHETLFSYTGIISIAVNGAMVTDWGSEVKSSDNITFFSPMAGG